jgi:hypothetical protein
MPQPQDMIPVQSSNILNIGYSSEDHELYVTFHKNGVETSTYVYFDFPEDEWEVFSKSPAFGGSFGRHFNEFIKKAGYRFVKL